MLIHVSMMYSGYPCPSTNPFVFNDGNSCCKSQEDHNRNPILYTSDSCKLGTNGTTQAIDCPRTPCRDNYGMSHTFVFTNKPLMYTKT